MKIHENGNNMKVVWKAIQFSLTSAYSLQHRESDSNFLKEVYNANTDFNYIFIYIFYF
jgi:hypothetical protein